MISYFIFIVLNLPCGNFNAECYVKDQNAFILVKQKEKKEVERVFVISSHKNMYVSKF